MRNLILEEINVVSGAHAAGALICLFGGAAIGIMFGALSQLVSIISLTIMGGVIGLVIGAATDNNTVQKMLSKYLTTFGSGDVNYGCHTPQNKFERVACYSAATCHWGINSYPETWNYRYNILGTVLHGRVTDMSTAGKGVGRMWIGRAFTASWTHRYGHYGWCAGVVTWRDPGL